MYSDKTGIPQIGDVTGGFEAGTSILIPAPPVSYADIPACALTKPLYGEYAIVLSTGQRAAGVVDSLKRIRADKRFTGVIDAITRSSTPCIPVVKGQVTMIS